MWDLAPHDLAIIDYCFKIFPKKILATASHNFKASKNFEMAHITLEYDNGFTAHIHVSWVSPIKTKNMCSFIWTHIYRIFPLCYMKSVWFFFPKCSINFYRSVLKVFSLYI
jgi:zona occludens toxin (predicted ATPase)